MGDHFTHFVEMMSYKHIFRYCLQDCRCLKECVDQFNQLFGEQTGLVPMSLSATCPAFLNKVWRADFLAHDELVCNEPQMGAPDRRSVSRLATTFLDYVESRDAGLEFEREKKYHRYTVDGYAGHVDQTLTFPGLEEVRHGAQLAVEVNGCLWCVTCWSFCRNDETNFTYIL